jgi:hypothetical protein
LGPTVPGRTRKTIIITRIAKLRMLTSDIRVIDCIACWNAGLLKSGGLPGFAADIDAIIEK